MMSNTFSILFLLVLVKTSVIRSSDSNDILQHLYDLEDGSAQEFEKMKFRDTIPRTKFEEFITMEEELPNKVLGDEYKVDDFEGVKNDWNTGYKVPVLHFAEAEKNWNKEEVKTPYDGPSNDEVESIYVGSVFKVPSFEELEKKTTKEENKTPYDGPSNKEEESIYVKYIKVPSLDEMEKERNEEENKTPFDGPHINDVQAIIVESVFKVPSLEEIEKGTNKVLGTPHDDELEILGIAVMSKIVLYMAIILLVLGAIVCTKFCCPNHYIQRRRGFVRMKDSDKTKVTPDKLQTV